LVKKKKKKKRSFPKRGKKVHRIKKGKGSSERGEVPHSEELPVSVRQEARRRGGGGNGAGESLKRKNGGKK